MKTIYYVLIAGVLITTQSCKTSFRISVQEPALIKLDNRYAHFGVINHVDQTNSPEKTVKNVLTGQQVNGNVVASERATEGMMRALQNSNGAAMQARTIEPEVVTNSDGTLNWTAIDSIAEAQNMDAIIELNEINSMSNLGGTVVANVSGTSSSYLQGTLYFTLHLLDTTLRYDRLAVSARYDIPVSGSTNILDILNDVQRKRLYFEQLGFNLGFEAGQQLYPNWVWVNRSYYNKGNRTLKSAAPMIYRGNWEIAEKRLLVDVDHRKRKVRGRILHNLALVNEGMGNIEKAIQYAEQAAFECDNKLANIYLVDLRYRQSQIQRL